MAPDSIFEDEAEVFHDIEVLEEDYTPDTILCRDEVMTEYINVLKPIYKGRPPQNAFLYGDTGVGKTAVTNHLTTQLEADIRQKNEDIERQHEQSEQETEEQTQPAVEPDAVDSAAPVDLTIVKVNCQNLTSTGERTSSYQVAIALVNELRPPKDMIASTGYAPQAVYSMLYEEMDALGGTVLVILDEVDRIGADDTILYELPRARANEKVENARIGLIGISNDYTFRSNLSPKVKDTLCETEIKFPAYNAMQLREILRDRASRALYDNTYGDDVIALCAALATRESSGSARKAINLLRRAGEIAENDGRTTILEADVHEAKDDLEYGDMVDSITDQDAHKRYVLAAVAHLSNADATPARVKEVHRAYRAVAESYAADPLSQRGMYNHLTKLAMLGFLTSHDNNEGIKGGQYYEFEFSDEVDRSKVREAFESMGHSWHDVRIHGS
ncbi:cell division control protein 6 [Haloprofundus marisrubri]|uniref:ORC1-type DNA replication protein n=1 Tax=Haloprofundus marisrubri TaxID=1514971 RepID=A0A0W1R8R9_9EURY|nr:orc1/cdc6 family replication initiation protein [Haloprofundus marisrubri]KTG09945.1 cell division control protein 6 [Haloprofundus marisrubri]